MSEPLTDADLAAMEQRGADATPALVAEVRRLRAANALIRERCAAVVDAFPRPSAEEIECAMLEHQPCLLGEVTTLTRLAAAIRALE